MLSFLEGGATRLLLEEPLVQTVGTFESRRPSVEPFRVHFQGTVGGYDFAFAGRCTAIAHSALPIVAFRVLLARAELELLKLPPSFRLRQSAFLLPNLRQLSDPIDLARASLSFLQRHPEYEAHYTLTRASIVGIASDVLLRVYPRLDARIVSDMKELGALLRKREPSLPDDWYELPKRPVRSIPPPS
jgi:hypothetical protein